MTEKYEVFQSLKKYPIVPVFFNSDFEVSVEIIKACYNGGARVFEFTNRGKEAKEVFKELIKLFSSEFKDAYLGIGSIIDEYEAYSFLELGADFIVSPMFSEGVAKLCNRHKVFWVPGVGSVTEIVKAHELGADLVKIFPAKEVGGPGFIKAVRGPIQNVKIMPTGGIAPNEENLKSWFESGAVCVGMGSALISKDRVKNKQFSEIQSLTKESINLAHKYSIHI